MVRDGTRKAGRIEVAEEATDLIVLENFFEELKAKVGNELAVRSEQ